MGNWKSIKGPRSPPALSGRAESDCGGGGHGAVQPVSDWEFAAVGPAARAITRPRCVSNAGTDPLTGAFDSERAMRGLRYQLHAPGEPKARHGNGTSAPRSTVDGTRKFVRQTAHVGMRTRQTKRRSLVTGRLLPVRIIPG